jgi:hypothetical protein
MTARARRHRYTGGDGGIQACDNTRKQAIGAASL